MHRSHLVVKIDQSTSVAVEMHQNTPILALDFKSGPATPNFPILQPLIGQNTHNKHLYKIEPSCTQVDNTSHITNRLSLHANDFKYTQ